MLTQHGNARRQVVLSHGAVAVADAAAGTAGQAGRSQYRLQQTQGGSTGLGGRQYGLGGGQDEQDAAGADEGCEVRPNVGAVEEEDKRVKELRVRVLTRLRQGTYPDAFKYLHRCIEVLTQLG